MNYFSDNIDKIEQFETIQNNLISLEPNTNDEEIKKVIDQIPKEYLNQKEDLMMICELFAIYARVKNRTKKRNAFKLFEGIMDYIKKYVSRRSYFYRYNYFVS